MIVRANLQRWCRILIDCCAYVYLFENDIKYSTSLKNKGEGISKRYPRVLSTVPLVNFDLSNRTELELRTWRLIKPYYSIPFASSIRRGSLLLVSERWRVWYCARWFFWVPCILPVCKVFQWGLLILMTIWMKLFFVVQLILVGRLVESFLGWFCSDTQSVDNCIMDYYSASSGRPSRRRPSSTTTTTTKRPDNSGPIYFPSGNNG